MHLRHPVLLSLETYYTERRRHIRNSLFSRNTPETCCAQQETNQTELRGDTRKLLFSKKTQETCCFQKRPTRESYKETNSKELPRDTRGLQPTRAANKPLFSKKTQETNCFKKRPTQKSNKETNTKNATIRHKRHKRPATKTSYGVPTITRLLKNIGLFGKRTL